MAAVTHGDLDSSGVCVVRSSGAEMVDACRACHAGVIESLDRMLSLPGTLGAPSDRHFLPFATCRGDGGAPPPTHQRDFLLPFSPWVEEVLQIALRGTEAGAILVQALGRDAELDGLQAITSEPGTAAQDLHSDAAWGTPRTVTVFLALHDILDETMGPTRFVPETHEPRCFPGRRWMPPPRVGGDLGERRTAWFALRTGDAVLMDSLTWHGAGANRGEQRRTLLAASFVNRSSEGRLPAQRPPGLRLGDFAL